MAISAGVVYAELVLDTSKYEQGLKKAKENTDSFTEKMSKVGEGMKKAGDKLTKYITTPIVGAGLAATKLGMDFEAQMSRVQAISGATGAELEKLNEVALQLGADTAFSASEVASAMENLASAGFSVNEIIAAIPGNLDLAAASGADLATATDIAASILRGFQLDAAEAGRVADVLAEAANRTNAQVEDMGESMKYIAPVAHAMGMSLEETAAAVGILADAGIKGSQAGTTLRGALTRLTKPTKQMKQVMNKLGLEFFDAQGNMKSLAEIIAELEEGTKGLTQEQKNQAIATLFGQEALSGMLVLIEQGPEKLRSLTKEFENSAGAAKETADIMMDNTKGSVEEMMGALETAGIKIFNIVAPVITDLAKRVGELADKFSALPEETQKNIIQLATFVALSGPVTKFTGNLVGGIAKTVDWFNKLSGATQASTTVVASLGNAAAIGTGKITGLGLATKASTILLNPWTAAIAAGGVAVYGLYKHLSEDAIPAVDLFGDSVSENTKEAVGSFLELEEQATKSLNQLAWSGQEVTGKMAEGIIGNFEGMKEQIVGKLEEQKERALASISEMVENSIDMTEKEKEEMIRIIGENYDEQIKKVEEGNVRIREILEKAKKEKRALTEEEKNEINKIREEMKNDGIRILSESEKEHLAIMERLKQESGKISALQAAEIVKNSKEQKEKTIAEAEKEYEERLKYAAELRASGSKEAEKMADKIAEEAKRQRDEAIKNAEEMHNKVVEQAKQQAGEHVNLVNWETGEVKTKWEVMKGNITQKAKEIKEDVTSKWREIKKSTAENWGNVEKSVSGSIKEVKEKISEGINKIKEWNRTKVKEKVFSIVEKVKRVFSSIRNAVSSVRAYARGTNFHPGGFALVGEQGPELVELPRGSKVYTANETANMLGLNEERLANAIVKALKNAGLSKPAVMQLDGREVGRGIVSIIDTELHSYSTEEAIGRGQLAW